MVDQGIEIVDDALLPMKNAVVIDQKDHVLVTIKDVLKAIQRAAVQASLLVNIPQFAEIAVKVVNKNRQSA